MLNNYWYWRLSLSTTYIPTHYTTMSIKSRCRKRQHKMILKCFAGHQSNRNKTNFCYNKEIRLQCFCFHKKLGEKEKTPNLIESYFSGRSFHGNMIYATAMFWKQMAKNLPNRVKRRRGKKIGSEEDLK